MKTNVMIAATALMLSSSLIISCGGEKAEEKKEEGKDTTAKVEEAPAPTFEEICKDTNAIAVTVKDYKYGMKGKFQFETGNFTVKQSSWNMTSDSTAELRLMNYAANELVGDRKPEQIDIVVQLTTKGGTKLGQGSYPYMEYKNNMSSSVTMTTSGGTVYFNWLAGMPEQGNVNIDYAGEDGICGSFALAVEKPDSEMIGIVRLNGKFVVKK